jgi:hypothetical protein
MGKQPLLIPVTETDRIGLILAAITPLPSGAFWRNNTGVLRDRTGRAVRFGLTGSGDILGSYHGRAVCLEVKTPEGKQRPDQRKFQLWWEAAGGIYAIVRTPEEALAVLRRVEAMG